MTMAWEAQLWDCAWCDETFTGWPIRDPVTASWLGSDAAIYCSQECMASMSDFAIEAAARQS